MKETLPHRFREGQFRKYEAAIADICNEWPGPSIFHPSSTETFSCRLRDAIKSLRNNQWDTKIIPMAKFVQICDEIVVSNRGDEVVCGEREMVRRAPEPLSQHSELSRLSKITLKSPDEVLAIAILKSGRVLIEPIYCNLAFKYSESELRHLEELWDVAIEIKDPENIVII